MPTLSFKVSPEEARAIRQKARAQRTTLSRYLRQSALGDIPVRKRRIILKKHPVSGLTVDAGPGPAVMQAEIDVALADFP